MKISVKLTDREFELHVVNSIEGTDLKDETIKEIIREAKEAILDLNSISKNTDQTT